MLSQMGNFINATDSELCWSTFQAVETVSVGYLADELSQLGIDDNDVFFPIAAMLPEHAAVLEWNYSQHRDVNCTCVFELQRTSDANHTKNEDDATECIVESATAHPQKRENEQRQVLRAPPLQQNPLPLDLSALVEPQGAFETRHATAQQLDPSQTCRVPTTSFWS
jgi:hypothetical protein